jgi:dihydrofolate reductase
VSASPSRPRLTIVVAMGRNRVIGRDGDMPWHLPADLAHFKQVTMGHPIVMGRRTWESIGKPLPGRENVVITRDQDYSAVGCTVVHSLEAALAGREGEVMVIGGGQIYRQAIDHATRIHMTVVDAEPEGDVTFPNLDPSWRTAARGAHQADERNEHDLSFITLERPTG